MCGERHLNLKFAKSKHSVASSSWTRKTLAAGSQDLPQEPGREACTVNIGRGRVPVPVPVPSLGHTPHSTATGGEVLESLHRLGRKVKFLGASCAVDVSCSSGMQARTSHTAVFRSGRRPLEKGHASCPTEGPRQVPGRALAQERDCPRR